MAFRLTDLPKDMCRLIGSFIDDLRPLRQATRALLHNPEVRIELEVLLDRAKLQAFFTSLQTFMKCDMQPQRMGIGATGDLVPYSIADQALHDAVVLAQSPVLWRLLTQQNAIRPSEIIVVAIKHRVNPVHIFTFVDPLRNTSEWDMIEQWFLHLFMPGGGLVYSTCIHCQLNANRKSMEYGVAIFRHYVVELGHTHLITRLFQYLTYARHEWDVLISGLQALMHHQVFTRQAFATWLITELMFARMRNYSSTYITRLEQLHAWTSDLNVKLNGQ